MFVVIFIFKTFFGDLIQIIEFCICFNKKGALSESKPLNDLGPQKYRARVRVPYGPSQPTLFVPAVGRLVIEADLNTSCFITISSFDKGVRRST